MNHLIVSACDPQAVGQVMVDVLVCRLDHPVVILPLDEHIRILVIVVFAVTLRILGGGSSVFILGEGIFQLLVVGCPVLSRYCVVCCPLSGSHRFKVGDALM